MADFHPFRAIRYNIDRLGSDWSALIAPPYDVLTADDKASLIAKSASNIVTIDMPFVPPTSAGPVEVYNQANITLQKWLADGILVRDPEPALYVYHQTYTVGGHTCTRRKILLAMRLEEFGKGTVYPHELTHGGPKEDRLCLMRATKCQLSPVFGIFSDPPNAVSAALSEIERPPDVTATMDGVKNELWIETDFATVEHVMTLIRGNKVYIADGHHRYSTAVNYRNEVAQAAGGTLPADHPANFVLVCLCAMEDPGLQILPTHRILSAPSGLTAEKLLSAWAPACEFKTVTDSVRDPAGLTRREAPHDIAMYDAATDAFYTGTFKHRGILAKLSPDRSEAWRKLDLAYLHRYMIEDLLINGLLGGEKPTIAYSAFADKAKEMALQARGVTIFVKPTIMEELRAVSLANDFMPQKSTYFFPKLATGMVIHPLA